MPTPLPPPGPHPRRRLRRRNIFNERDLARAVRAAHRAGGVARIEISSDNGTITLRLAEPPKDNSAVPETVPTPLEQWRAKHSGQG
jgi:hypothetical protein